MNRTRISPRFLLFFSIIGILLSGIGNAFAQNHTILFKSGAYVPEAGFDKFINHRETFKGSLYNDNYYVLMQFNTLPGKAEKQAMKEAGIKLGDYIPNNAFYALIPSEINPEMLSSIKLRTILSVPSNSKIDPILLSGVLPANVEKTPGILDVKLKYYGTIGFGASEVAMIENGAEVLNHSAGTNTMNIRVKKELLEQIASLPWVAWIAPLSPEKSINNNYGRPLHRDNVLQSMLSGQRGLSGKNVKVGLFDVGNPYTHIDIKRRLNQEYAGPFADHSTHCAGTIAGAGLMDPNGKGMAPESIIYSWSFYGSVEDSTWHYEPVFNYKVTSNSFGYGTGYYGGYDYNSWILDTLAYVYKNVSQIFAAGNSGSGYNTVSSGGNSAKNTITVGALDRDTIASFSSRGPVNDGRLKPEVCALGVNVYSTLPYNTYDKYSGTSMATPGTAGTVALLYERFRQLNSGQDPQSDLIKAILMNSAYDMGNPGPDFTYGYGRIDGLAAVRTIEAQNYLLDSVGTNDTFKLPFTLSSVLVHSKIMLNWTDAPPSAITSRMLVNDLDLKLITPSGDTLLPWVLDPLNQNNNAIRAIDTLNVEEQITADSLQAGSYLLLVIGKTVPIGPQHFALTWQKDTSGIELTSPLGGETYTPARPTLTASGYQYNDIDQVAVSWESSPTNIPFDIYFSADKGVNWTYIGTAPSYRRNFFWTVPDTFSSQCLIRITSGSFSSMSDSTFTILQTPGFQYTTSCQKSAVLAWGKVPHASSYDVMRLSSDSTWNILKNVTDTFYIDSAVTSFKDYWYAVRSVGAGGGVSQNCIAVNLSTGTTLVNCSSNIDAGISAIDSPAFGFCTGNVNVYAHLNNYGLNPLSSATINWSVNGVAQKPYKWTGLIGLGGSASVLVGTVSLTAGTSYDIKAYTSVPNGGVDGVTQNDTGYRFGILDGLSGTYSVGIISPIYGTISSAIDDLNSRGVCGAVTFQILDGNYTEQPILYSVRGSSPANTITFESQSGDSSLVNWNYPNNYGNNFVFMLYGASYINIKNLTLQRTGSGILSTARVLNISGGSHHVDVMNNQIIGVYGASTLCYFSESVDSAINLSNNYLKYGNYGVYLNSYYGYDATNNKIKGNIIDSASIDAMYIGYQSGLAIVDNRITNTGAGDNSNYINGMSLTGCDDALNIERNRIDMQNIIIQAYGINLSSSFASSTAPGSITNNFISMSCKDTNQSPYGISLYYTTNQNVYFNNVNIYNKNLQGIPFLSYYNYGYGNNVENNNFSNFGGSYAMYINPAAYFDSVNYNNIYSSGSTLANWDGTDYAGIASYLTGTSQNNTIGINPLYNSNSDLHVNAKSLEHSGKSISGISMDIDGVTRATIPTIGATELKYLDGGITTINNGTTSYCESTQNIVAEVKNYGIETLTSATVNWSVNGTLQTAYSWTGTLKTGDSTSAKTGSYSLLGGNTYKIKIWLSNTNSTKDFNHLNDTLTSTIIANTLPSASVGKSTSICQGDSIQIGGPFTSGNTYTWTSNPSGFISAISNPYVSPASATVYRLTETVTATGCSKSDSVTIKVNSLPSVYAGKGSTICAGNSVSIGNAPIPTHTYSWTSDPSGFTSSSSGPSVTPKTTTTYYVTETNGSTGCSAKDSVTINVNLVPVVTIASSKSICKGDTTNIGGASVSGYSYSWTSNPSGYTSANSNPAVSPLVTTTYYLTDTIRATGCTAMDSVTITVNFKPTPSVFGSTPACAGGIGSFSTGFNSTSSYKWIISGGSLSSGSGTNLIGVKWGSAGAGTIKVIEMTTSGCSDSSQIKVTIHNDPVAKYFSSRICNGNATKFSDSSSNHKSQLWMFGDGDTASSLNPSHTYKNAGMYIAGLIVTDSNGCFDSVKNNIVVDTLPKAHWTAIAKVPSFTFIADDTSLNALAYSWKFGDGKSAGNFKVLHTYINDSVYSVSLSVTGHNGCVNIFDSSVAVLRTFIASQTNEMQLDIYPNPFKEVTSLEYTLVQSANVKIALFSVDGKQLATPMDHFQNSGKYVMQISAENLGMAPGVYFLRMYIGDQEVITKQIIRVK